MQVMTLAEPFTKGEKEVQLSINSTQIYKGKNPWRDAFLYTNYFAIKVTGTVYCDISPTEIVWSPARLLKESSLAYMVFSHLPHQN